MFRPSAPGSDGLAARFKRAGWLRRVTAVGGRMSAAGGEALAFARQASLLHRDWSDDVPRVDDEGDVAVLMHGMFASAGVMRPLRRALSRAGIATATMTYPPGPGIDALCDRVQQVASQLPRGARMHLVGHSLGGVVLRHWALSASDARVVQTISLASPFAGVQSASWFGFQAARDLAPGSGLLRDLRLSQHASVPHLSIVAGRDQIVHAPMTHALVHGEVELLPELGHNALLYDERVWDIVVRRVTRAPGSAACTTAE